MHTRTHTHLLTSRSRGPPPSPRASGPVVLSRSTFADHMRGSPPQLHYIWQDYPQLYERGAKDEHFIVWMRTAGLPEVRARSLRARSAMHPA